MEHDLLLDRFRNCCSPDNSCHSERSEESPYFGRAPDIAVATTFLPDDFHGDRLIAATAQTHHLTLCTHDHALLRFGKQGIYRFLEV